MLLSLLAINWLVLVTVVTVLWKSSLPTTLENVTRSSECHFLHAVYISNVSLFASHLSIASFYRLMFYACFELHVETKGIFVAVACTLLKVVVVMLCVSWCWLAWVSKLLFSLHGFCCIIAFVLVQLCVQQLSHFPLSRIQSHVITVHLMGIRHTFTVTLWQTKKNPLLSWKWIFKASAQVATRLFMFPLTVSGLM